MKKYLIIMFLLFAPVMVCAKEYNVRLEYVPNVYWNYKKDGITYWGQFAYIYVNDNIGYCLDIFSIVNSSNYTQSDEEIEEYARLYAYFGYGYENNSTLYDYMAAQKLIWQRTSKVDVFFTTLSGGKGNIISVYDEISTLTARINKYFNFPYYDHLNLLYGTSKKFEHMYSTEGEFRLVNNTNNNVSFDDDYTITIDGNEIGDFEFTLEKDVLKKFDSGIYIANNSQKIMSVGDLDTRKINYSYSVKGAYIKVTLYPDVDIGEDITTNVFGLYDSNNNLLSTYKCDSNGQIYIEGLPAGKYVVRLLNVMNGYKTLHNEFSVVFDNTLDFFDAGLVLYALKGSINVNLNLDEDFGSNKKDNIFELYDKNNNKIGTYNSDENGTLLIDNLYVGEYTLKYVNVMYPYNVNTKEYKITIKNDDLDIQKNIDLELIKGSLDIKVELDEDLGFDIKENLFELYDSKDNLIKKCNSDELGKIVISDLYIGKYILKQVQVMTGYIANSRKYEIEINTDNLNQKQTIYLNALKGSVNINLESNESSELDFSKNELLLLDDNNNIILTINTNKEGNTLINDLCIGKYTLKINKIINGYYVSQENYLFEITKENLNQNIDIVLYVMQTNVRIIKTYTNVLTNDERSDSGVIYEIYDCFDNFVKEIVTDINGIAETNLKYGYYIIKQKNVKKINYVHDNIIIDQTMFNDSITKIIHDNIFEFNIRIKFLDKKNDEVLNNVSFIFNNEYYETENGIYIIKDSSFKEYVISNVESKNYNKINNIEFNIDINDEFVIENNTAYKDIKIYFEEIISDNNIVLDEVISKEDDFIEENIDNEINNNNNETIEKLPLLGEDKYEKKYIFCSFIICIIIFKWMYRIYQR